MPLNTHTPQRITVSNAETLDFYFADLRQSDSFIALLQSVPSFIPETVSMTIDERTGTKSYVVSFPDILLDALVGATACERFRAINKNYCNHRREELIASLIDPANADLLYLAAHLAVNSSNGLLSSVASHSSNLFAILLKHLSPLALQHLAIMSGVSNMILPDFLDAADMAFFIAAVGQDFCNHIAHRSPDSRGFDLMRRLQQKPDIWPAFVKTLSWRTALLPHTAIAAAPNWYHHQQYTSEFRSLLEHMSDEDCKTFALHLDRQEQSGAARIAWHQSDVLIPLLTRLGWPFVLTLLSTRGDKSFVHQMLCKRGVYAQKPGLYELIEESLRPGSVFDRPDCVFAMQLLCLLPDNEFIGYIGTMDSAQCNALALRHNDTDCALALPALWLSTRSNRVFLSRLSPDVKLDALLLMPPQSSDHPLPRLVNKGQIALEELCDRDRFNERLLAQTNPGQNVFHSFCFSKFKAILRLYEFIKPEQRMAAVFQTNDAGIWALDALQDGSNLGLKLVAHMRLHDRDLLISFIQNNPHRFSAQVLAKQKPMMIIALADLLQVEQLTAQLWLDDRWGEPLIWVYIRENLFFELCQWVSERGLIESTLSTRIAVQLMKSSPPEVIQYLQALYTNRVDLSRQSLGAVQGLSEIELFDGGRSDDLWSRSSRQQLAALRGPKPGKPQPKLIEAFLRNRIDLANIARVSLHEYSPAGSFVKFQGRTIILQQGDTWRALKFQKHSETDGALEREFNTLSTLHEKREELGLLSDLPQPVGIMAFTDLVEWLNNEPACDPASRDTFLNMIYENGSNAYTTFVYDMNGQQKTWLRYLHSPVIAASSFREANYRVVHDLCVLLQKGVVYAEMADIFHNHDGNRPDGGRYRVFINILNNYALGLGRINAWKDEAVKYPDMRESGIADVGDWISINDLLYSSEYVQANFKDVHTRTGDKTGNVLLANIMGEYLYILYLIAGARALDLSADAPAERMDAIWLEAAAQQIENSAQMVSLLSPLSIEQARDFLSHKVDVHRLARQMRYWMTDEYKDDIRANRVRDGIYARETIVKVDAARIRAGTFDFEPGSSDEVRSADLGLVNGQEPIKEADMLRHEALNLIVNACQQAADTLRVVKLLGKVSDPVKAARLRNHFFYHLPVRQRSLLQIKLCDEELGKNDCPPALKTEIEAQRSGHGKRLMRSLLEDVVVRRRAHQGDVATPPRLQGKII